MEHHKLESWNNQQTSHMSRPGGEKLHNDCFGVDDEEELENEIEKEEDMKMEESKTSGEGESNAVNSPQLSTKTVAYTDHGESGVICAQKQTPNIPSKECGNWVARA